MIANLMRKFFFGFSRVPCQRPKATILEVRDGKISRQVNVESWDE